MDREIGGKLIHAAWVDSKIIPDGISTGDIWDTLTEEAKERYRVAADAFSSEFLKNLEGRVIKIIDGQITQVMTNEQLNITRRKLAKHTKLWNADREYFPDLVRSAVESLEHKEQKQIQRLKRFQDDSLTYLRALSLIATSVGNAGTHSEKNARLRGMISLIESAIQSVRDGYEDLLTREWAANPDLFRSDYPVRSYIEKINQLQDEIKSLKTNTTQSGNEPDPDDIPM